MKGLSVLQILPYALLLTSLFARPATSATGTAVRADLTHVDSGRGFTKRVLLRRMAARSRARAASLRSSARHGHGGTNARTRTVTAPVARGVDDAGTEYLVHFHIGAPRPQRVALEVDTGSDLIWTQCACAVCFDQTFPAFDSGASRAVLCSDPICAGGFDLSGCTLHTNACFYGYSYGDNSTTWGQIIEDTFTFKAPDGKGGAVAVPEVRFGCGMYNAGTFISNESGIAGFGRGPLSLPSQLKVGKFSYCFTTFSESKSSPVFLGTPDNLTGPAQSTPFVRYPAGRWSSLYYLSLRGITVGATRLPVNESAFALKADGSGGTIIVSGTGLTTLTQSAFVHLRSAFESLVPLPVSNSSVDADSMLCFSAASVADMAKVPVPRLVFHLDGANWDMPRGNYIWEDHADRELCVAIYSAGDGGMTVIGNFQQQNMHMVYDLESDELVFVPARCDEL